MARCIPKACHRLILRGSVSVLASVLAVMLSMLSLFALAMFSLFALSMLSLFALLSG